MIKYPDFRQQYTMLQPSTAVSACNVQGYTPHIFDISFLVGFQDFAKSVFNSCQLPTGHLFRFISVGFKLEDQAFSHDPRFPFFQMTLGQFILRFERSYELIFDQLAKLQGKNPLKCLLMMAIQLSPKDWTAMQSLSFVFENNDIELELITYNDGAWRQDPTCFAIYGDENDLPFPPNSVQYNVWDQFSKSQQRPIESYVIVNDLKSQTPERKEALRVALTFEVPIASVIDKSIVKKEIVDHDAVGDSLQHVRDEHENHDEQREQKSSSQEFFFGKNKPLHDQREDDLLGNQQVQIPVLDTAAIVTYYKIFGQTLINMHRDKPQTRIKDLFVQISQVSIDANHFANTMLYYDSFAEKIDFSSHLKMISTLKERLLQANGWLSQLSEEGVVQNILSRIFSESVREMTITDQYDTFYDKVKLYFEDKMIASKIFELQEDVYQPFFYLVQYPGKSYAQQLLMSTLADCIQVIENDHGADQSLKSIKIALSCPSEENSKIFSNFMQSLMEKWPAILHQFILYRAVDVNIQRLFELYSQGTESQDLNQDILLGTKRKQSEGSREGSNLQNDSKLRTDANKRKRSGDEEAKLGGELFQSKDVSSHDRIYPENQGSSLFQRKSQPDNYTYLKPSQSCHSYYNYKGTPDYDQGYPQDMIKSSANDRVASQISQMVDVDLVDSSQETGDSNDAQNDASMLSNQGRNRKKYDEQASIEKQNFERQFHEKHHSNENDESKAIAENLIEEQKEGEDQIINQNVRIKQTQSDIQLDNPVGRSVTESDVSSPEKIVDSKAKPVDQLKNLQGQVPVVDSKEQQMIIEDVDEPAIKNPSDKSEQLPLNNLTNLINPGDDVPIQNQEDDDQLDLQGSSVAEQPLENQSRSIQQELPGAEVEDVQIVDEKLGDQRPVEIESAIKSNQANEPLSKIQDVHSSLILDSSKSVLQSGVDLHPPGNDSDDISIVQDAALDPLKSRPSKERSSHSDSLFRDNAKLQSLSLKIKEVNARNKEREQALKMQKDSVQPESSLLTDDSLDKDFQNAIQKSKGYFSVTALQLQYELSELNYSELVYGNVLCNRMLTVYNALSKTQYVYKDLDSLGDRYQVCMYKEKQDFSLINIPFSFEGHAQYRDRICIPMHDVYDPFQTLSSTKANNKVKFKASRFIINNEMIMWIFNGLMGYKVYNCPRVFDMLCTLTYPVMYPLQNLIDQLTDGITQNDSYDLQRLSKFFLFDIEDMRPLQLHLIRHFTRKNDSIQTLKLNDMILQYPEEFSYMNQRGAKVVVEIFFEHKNRINRCCYIAEAVSEREFKVLTPYTHSKNNARAKPEANIAQSVLADLDFSLGIKLNQVCAIRYYKVEILNAQNLKQLQSENYFYILKLRNILMKYFFLFNEDNVQNALDILMSKGLIGAHILNHVINIPVVQGKKDWLSEFVNPLEDDAYLRTTCEDGVLRGLSNNFKGDCFDRDRTLSAITNSFSLKAFQFYSETQSQNESRCMDILTSMIQDFDQTQKKTPNLALIFKSIINMTCIYAKRILPYDASFVHSFVNQLVSFTRFLQFRQFTFLQKVTPGRIIPSQSELPLSQDIFNENEIAQIETRMSRDYVLAKQSRVQYIIKTQYSPYSQEVDKVIHEYLLMIQRAYGGEVKDFKSNFKASLVSSQGWRADNSWRVISQSLLPDQNQGSSSDSKPNPSQTPTFSSYNSTIRRGAKYVQQTLTGRGSLTGRTPSSLQQSIDKNPFSKLDLENQKDPFMLSFPRHDSNLSRDDVEKGAQNLFDVEFSEDHMTDLPSSMKKPGPARRRGGK